MCDSKNIKKTGTRGVWISKICINWNRRRPDLSTYIISLVLFACSGVRLSFPSIRPAIRPVIHPSKFRIPEEEDDGTGGGGQLMGAAAVYPNEKQEKKSF